MLFPVFPTISEFSEILPQLLNNSLLTLHTPRTKEAAFITGALRRRLRLSYLERGRELNSQLIK